MTLGLRSPRTSRWGRTSVFVAAFAIAAVHGPGSGHLFAVGPTTGRAACEQNPGSDRAEPPVAAAASSDAGTQNGPAVSPGQTQEIGATDAGTMREIAADAGPAARAAISVN